MPGNMLRLWELVAESEALLGIEAAWENSLPATRDPQDQVGDI